MVPKKPRFQQQIRSRKFSLNGLRTPWNTRVGAAILGISRRSEEHLPRSVSTQTCVRDLWSQAQQTSARNPKLPGKGLTSGRGGDNRQSSPPQEIAGEGSQTQRPDQGMSPFPQDAQNRWIQTQKVSRCGQGLEGRCGRKWGERESVQVNRGDENVLKLDRGGVCTTLGSCHTPLNCYSDMGKFYVM